MPSTSRWRLWAAAGAAIDAGQDKAEAQARTVSRSSGESFSPSLSSSVDRMLYTYVSSAFLASTRPLTFLSCSANSSASRTMRSISSWERRPLSFVIVIRSLLPAQPQMLSLDCCFVFELVLDWR